MHLAIAYTWITEGTWDKEYVKTHTFGYEKFEPYVLGKETGSQDPKWAEGKCGVPARIIKALARAWAAKKTSTAHGNGGSMVRGPFSTEPARLEVLLLTMQGIGKPGRHQFKMIEWGLFGDPGQYPMPKAVALPDVMAAAQGQRGSAVRAMERGLLPVDGIPRMDWPKQNVPKTLIPDAILNPPLKWYGTTSAMEPVEDQFKEYQYPMEAAPKSTWSGRIQSPGLPAGTMALSFAMPGEVPKLSLFYPSIPGWRMMPCMPILSCRPIPSWKKMWILPRMRPAASSW
jgi:trimethylamine-N-oxide reductase (cytochrome c)